MQIGVCVHDDAYRRIWEARCGRALLRIGLALAATWIWLATCLAVARPAAAETVAPVFQQKLPNIDDKTLTVVTVDFPPGAQAAPHQHGQAFVYAYVLQGAIRSRLEDQPAQIYAMGQSWSELPGSHHVLTENASASEPARLLVVFVADIGAPLKTDDH
jgi:quercetin dioxygenase-like cupin family protein